MDAEPSQLVLAAVTSAYGALLTVAGISADIPPVSWTGLVAIVGGIYGYAELRGRIGAKEEAQEKHNQFIEAAMLRVAHKVGADLSDLRK